MTTKRRQSPPQEPAPQPRLLRPAEEIKSQIDERLTAGQELVESPVTDAQSLEARQDDYYSWDEYNERLLKNVFDSPEPANQYRSVFATGWPSDRPWHDRWNWLRQDISDKVRRLRSVRDQIDLFQVHPDVSAPDRPAKSQLSFGDEIFIVHGHNEEVKATVARFLQRLLKREPVILAEQPDSGRTIIEKFEHYAAMAACAVVLLTGDDMGASKSGEQQLRARQNVVLELGFFIAKLGRSRVVILYEPGVEVPSDIQGVLYTELDSVGAWRMAVAQELKAIDLDIDAEALLS